MWRTPREVKENNTAAPRSDDRCKYEESEKQRKQSADSKQPKSKRISQKPLKEFDEVDKYKTPDFTAEFADSCFISGPQCEPIDFEDVQAKVEDATQLVIMQTKNPQHKESYKVNTSNRDEVTIGRRAIANRINNSGKHVDNVDSGVVEDESNEEEDADADNVADAYTSNLNHRLALDWEQFYKQNDDGDTALHLACIAGGDKYIEVLTALINMAPHPCVFNIKNDRSQTTLHLAVLTAQPNVVRALLLAGAEPTVRDRNGNTALHLACMSGQIQCVRALARTFSLPEIHDTCSSSHLEISNYDGERCVHIAAYGGHIETLRILVSRGADINAREGKSGLTPLHIAIERRNEDLSNFLLEECKKLNLEIATYGGSTAYQFAWILNDAHTQNILRKRGAKPLAPSDSDSDSSDKEEAEDGPEKESTCPCS